MEEAKLVQQQQGLLSTGQGTADLYDNASCYTPRRGRVQTRQHQGTSGPLWNGMVRLSTKRDPSGVRSPASHTKRHTPLDRPCRLLPHLT